MKIYEVVIVEPGIADVFVRCHTGDLWVGDTVHLTDENHETVSGPLTVAEIRRGPQVPPVRVLSPTHRGKLRVAGEVAQSALAAWVVGGA